MIKEPKLHKETRPFFFFFLIGKISSVTAKYEMLGDRATDCKSVARGGRQTRWSDPTCVKIMIEFSGAKFKRGKSWGENNLTGTRLGGPIAREKSQGVLGAVESRKLQLRTDLLNKTVPTGSPNYNQIAQTWKAETQKLFIRDYSPANCFFKISGLQTVAWQTCVVLFYP